MQDITGMFPIHSQDVPVDAQVIIEWPTTADASGVKIFDAKTGVELPGALSMALTVDPRSSYPTAHVVHLVDGGWNRTAHALVGPGGRPLTGIYTYQVTGFQGAWTKADPCIHVRHVEERIKAGANYDPFTDDMGVAHRWDMDWMDWIHPEGQVLCADVHCNASSYRGR